MEFETSTYNTDLKYTILGSLLSNLDESSYPELLQKLKETFGDEIIYKLIEKCSDSSKMDINQNQLKPIRSQKIPSNDFEKLKKNPENHKPYICIATYLVSGKVFGDDCYWIAIPEGNNYKVYVYKKLEEDSAPPYRLINPYQSNLFIYDKLKHSHITSLVRAFKLIPVFKDLFENSRLLRVSNFMLIKNLIMEHTNDSQFLSEFMQIEDLPDSANIDPIEIYGWICRQILENINEFKEKVSLTINEEYKCVFCKHVIKNSRSIQFMECREFKEINKISKQRASEQCCEKCQKKLSYGKIENIDIPKVFVVYSDNQTNYMKQLDSLTILNKKIKIFGFISGNHNSGFEFHDDDEQFRMKKINPYLAFITFY